MNARPVMQKQERKKLKMTVTHHAHTLGADDIYLKLRQRGYRITKPRRLLIDALLSASTPKNAKEIARHTGIKDLSTVYRTLTELVKEGLVSELTDDGIAYYELHEHHHDHAICDACGTIEHIPCGMTKVPKALIRNGFTPTTHEIIWRGVCAKCV